MSVVTIFASGEAAVPQTFVGVRFPAAADPAPATVTAAPAAPPPAIGHVVQQAADGLFYIDASINGKQIHFVVDTGSSVVILNAADAARAGVTNDEQVDVETAGGAASMHRAHLAHVVVAGKAMRDVDAAIVRTSLPTSLLGQNVLSQLGSVTLKGNQMAFD